MNRENLLRKALWAATVFNVGGAYLFAFPASPISNYIGLPADVPALYRSFTALFILLFGGAYAWLAVQRPIIRPFVIFTAIGKASAFTLGVALFLFGELTLTALAVLSGDLVLAAVFFWCVSETRKT